MAYATLNQIITSLEKLVTTGKIGSLDNVRRMVLKHPPTNTTKIIPIITDFPDGSREIFFDGGV